MDGNATEASTAETDEASTTPVPSAPVTEPAKISGFGSLVGVKAAALMMAVAEGFAPRKRR